MEAMAIAVSPNGSAFSGQQQRWPDPILHLNYAARRQPRSSEPSCRMSLQRLVGRRARAPTLKQPLGAVS